MVLNYGHRGGFLMKQLEYPYDSDFILRKKKAIRRELLAREGVQYIDKKIAILGGSTTSDIKLILELFLLNYGIRPTFFESEYNKYFEDAVFGNPELDEFAPDLVFVHTTTRNIAKFPEVTDSPEQIDSLLEETMHPGEGVMKEEKFPHSRKHSHRHVSGELWNLRGQHNW